MLFICSVHSPPITQMLASSRRFRRASTSALEHAGDCRPHRTNRPLGCARALQAVARRRPRRVTVFAERCHETGAAHPQKQRRGFTPALVVRFVRFRSHVSPSHARSRRLQRASSPVPHVSLGQTSRPRPGEPQRNDITFAARRPSPRARRFLARGSPATLAARHASCTCARKGMRSCTQQLSRRAAPAALGALSPELANFHHATLSSARLSPVAAPKTRLRLSWPAASWLRALPRARPSRALGSRCESLSCGPRSLIES